MGNNDYFELAQFIEEMIDDFATDFHEVCLVFNKDENKEQDGRHIRAASNRNPWWYREICKAFPKRKQAKRKKPQSSVTKADVLNVMKTIMQKGKSESKYAPFIIEEAQRRHDAYFVPFDGQF